MPAATVTIPLRLGGVDKAVLRLAPKPGSCPDGFEAAGESRGGETTPAVRAERGAGDLTHDSLMSVFRPSLADPRLWFVAGLALVAGAVRGFSGFGGGQILIPLASAALGPKAAVPLFYLCDLFTASLYGLRYLRQCRWREIAPMILGSWLLLPFGAWALRSIDPIVLRWATDILVLGTLALLISGWRYRGRPAPPLSFGVGAVAGFMGGATGISAPLVIAYWLGSKVEAGVVRSNIMVFYSLNSFYTNTIYLIQGLFVWQTAARAIVVGPMYALGLWGGARLFHGASDRFYRGVAFTIIALAALLGMPIFDRWLH